MDLGLRDQVAFVAGSSRGIGRAIAAALLAEGARVVLTGRDAESLGRAEEELGRTAEDAGRVTSIAGDFSDRGTIEAAFRLTAERCGRIDHLIANLGTGSGKGGWEQEEAEWSRLFEANFFSSVRLAEAAVPYLRGGASLRGGVSSSMLFVSSIVAIEATPAPLPYSAAKAALTNYAKNLSRLLAPEEIRVNTICPGNILFPGGSWERHLGARRVAVESMLATEVPQRRFGTPEEIAGLAAYLCSGRAGFATGGTFVIDGGQTRAI